MPTDITVSNISHESNRNTHPQSSASIINLAKALCAAQGEFKNVVKNAENPFFKSKYADLGAVIDETKDVLAKNGLSVIQTNFVVNEKNYLRTTLLHSSGEWILSELILNPVKNDPQGIGSAISYGRRYSLQAILNLGTCEDDDGNAASQAPQAPRSQRQVVQSPLSENNSNGCISEKQKARLFAIASQSGWKFSEVEMWIIDKYKVKSQDLPWELYKPVVDFFSKPRAVAQSAVPKN